MASTSAKFLTLNLIDVDKPVALETSDFRKQEIETLEKSW